MMRDLTGTRQMQVLKLPSAWSVGIFKARERGLKHIAQGGARLCERNPGHESEHGGSPQRATATVEMSVARCAG